MTCQCETCDCQAVTLESGGEPEYCCHECASVSDATGTGDCPCGHAGCSGTMPRDAEPLPEGRVRPF